MARRIAVLFALWLGLTHCAGQTGTPTAATSGPCSPIDPRLPAADGTRGEDLWLAFNGRRELNVKWRAQDAAAGEETPLRLSLTITRADWTDAPVACTTAARTPVVVQIETDDGSLAASARAWLIGTADHATMNLLDAPADRPKDHNIAAVIDLGRDGTDISLTLDPGGATLESLGDDPSRFTWAWRANEGTPHVFRVRSIAATQPKNRPEPERTSES
jgi:hypothetical protein